MSETRREDLVERLRHALEEVERLKKERDKVMADLIFSRERCESLKGALKDVAEELGRLRTLAAERAER